MPISRKQGASLTTRPLRAGDAPVSRRSFLKMAAAATGVLAAAGCGPAAENGQSGPAGSSGVEKLTVLLWLLEGDDMDRILKEHPWVVGLKEHERENANVKVDVVVRGSNWAQMATWLASGDPPDLVIGSPEEMRASLPNTPFALQLDVGPSMLPEDRSDFDDSLLDNVRMTPGGKEFIQGWPLDVSYGLGLAANAAILEQSGVDWTRVQERGWTWDEFVEAARKGVDRAQGPVLAATPGGLGQAIAKLAENAGQADSMESMWAEFGNVWQFQGPVVVEVAGFVSDWLNKHNLTTSAYLSLPNSNETLKLLLQGSIVFTTGSYSGTLDLARRYSRRTQASTPTGKEAEVVVCALPFPHHESANPVAVARGSALYVFRQKPFKGDEHSRIALDVARLLAGRDMQVKVARYGGAWGQVPARKSARDLAPPEDPQLQRLMRYFDGRLRWAIPVGHPSSRRWQGDSFGPANVSLVSGKIGAQEYEEELRNGGDKGMKTWLQTETTREMVEYWESPPEGFPGPLFPKWKQRTREEAGY